MSITGARAPIADAAPARRSGCCDRPSARRPGVRGAGRARVRDARPALVGSGRVVSPHRVAGLRHAVFHTWIDDAVTAAAQELFPEWVRWNGERSGLPEHLLDHAVAVAAGAPRTERDCPGAGIETTAG